MAKYKEAVIQELCDFKHLGRCLGDCGIFKRYGNSGRDQDRVVEIINACKSHEAFAAGNATAYYEYPFECQNERA